MRKPIFYSEGLQKQFDQDGIIEIPLLNSDDISMLNSFYRSSLAIMPDSNFHSTMFVSDAGYRQRIDEGIRKLILPKINEIVQDYRMLFSNFIVKSPGADTGVGIHQDWNFAFPEYTSINFWIPLIDIDERTGLFYALRGSHRTFNNIRYTPYEDNRYAGLEEYILKTATPYRIKAGTAIIYHGALVHFSDANVSDAMRIAVGAVLIPSEAKNVHYFKRAGESEKLEVYEVSEDFYHRFNFFEEPRGEKKIDEILTTDSVPTLDYLKLNMPAK